MPGNYFDIKSKLIDEAKVIFKNNFRSGYSPWKKTDYKYIAPADKEYIYQWLWDTGFHAIVLSSFDAEWAKSEIKNFLLAQREDGFLPHIIFWGSQTFLPHWAYLESYPSLRPQATAITQPPVFAISVEKIYQKNKDIDFLKEVVPKLALYHKWLINNRDTDKDYLLSIISPNESGMDELPVFQLAVGFEKEDIVRLHYAFRKADLLNQRYGFNNKVILGRDYFNVEELLFNTVFIEANRSLARLLTETGDFEKAKFFEQLASKGELSLIKKCWDETDQIFYSIFSKNEKKAKVKTIASLLPLYLTGLKGKKLKALIAHLVDTDEFWTPYPIPSVSRDEVYYHPTDTPSYKIKLLWRGPVWMNTNWFIVQGLRKHGFNEVADKIVEKMVDLVKKSGFREYYNPETGEGYRRENFGWSTLLIDLL